MMKEAVLLSETEKITINMNVVELGQIDLLVSQGCYSNRTDFMRAAIRDRLNSHAELLKQTTVRKQLAVGIFFYRAKDLEALRQANEQVDLKVIGMVVLDREITPELAKATIRSLELHGVLKASDQVRAALADRMG